MLEDEKVLEAAVKAAEPQARMAILKELLRDMSLLEKVRREQQPAEELLCTAVRQ